MTYLMCNVPLIYSITMYHDIQNTQKDLHTVIIESMDKLLPENAHEMCNGKLHIMLSRMTIWGFEKVIINYFKSRQHLLDVLSASIFLPGFTSQNVTGILIENERYFDGWFHSNIPINKNNDLPQLVIETHNVNYDSKHIFTMTDNCPELLIIKGAIEMEQFLNNKHISSLPLKWYKNNKNNKNNQIIINNEDKIINKKNKFYFLFPTLILMLVLSCILFIFKFLFAIIA